MLLDWISTLAAAASAIFAAYELFKNRRASEKALKRERKQATIEAYNILQEQALDILNAKYSEKSVEEIAQNHRKEEFREEYKRIGTLLARCEHFAVGIEEETYDFDTLYRLSGKHLWYLSKRFSSVIREKQKMEKARTHLFKN